MAVVLAWLAVAWTWTKWAVNVLSPQTWAVVGLAAVMFFAGCHCGRGFGAEPPFAYKPCPVNGINCTCGCQSGAQCNCTAPDPVAASVRVDVPYTDGSLHSGSGTVVALYSDATGKASCVIVTNQHVCPKGDCQITVHWPSGFTSAANWLGCDSQVDIAAICAYAPPDAVACRPAKDAPATGEKLTQVGYPHTNGPVKRIGPALESNGLCEWTGQPLFRAKIATEEGDSGSGLFNGEQKLVAVVHGIPTRREHGRGEVCHAVGLTELHRFLLRPATRKLFPELHGVVVPPRRNLMAQPVTYAPVFGGNCSGGNCRSR